MGVDHQPHIHIFQHAQTDKLLLAPHKLYFALFLQALAKLQFHILFRRYCRKGHVSTQQPLQRRQPHGGTQHRCDLTVLSAGMGGSGLGIGTGMQGTDHSIQFSHEHNIWTGHDTRKPSLDSRSGNPLTAGDA